MTRYITTLVSVILVGSAVVYAQVADISPVQISETPTLSKDLQIKVDSIMASTTLDTLEATKVLLQNQNADKLGEKMDKMIQLLSHIDLNLQRIYEK